MISYSDIDHSYRLIATGERLLSVTRACSEGGLGRNYNGVPPSVLKNAADRGTHVDQCCNLFDENDLAWDSVHPEALARVTAWRKFRERTGFVPVKCAEIVWHPVLKTAGTRDVRGYFPHEPDVRWVLDRKATESIHEDPNKERLVLAYCAQLTGYTLPGSLDQEGAPAGKERRGIVHLQKTGEYAFADVDEEQRKWERDDVAAFTATVAIARWKLASGQNGGRRR